jgi:hypothetical protein
MMERERESCSVRVSTCILGNKDHIHRHTSAASITGFLVHYAFCVAQGLYESVFHQETGAEDFRNWSSHRHTYTRNKCDLLLRQGTAQ